MAAKVEIDSETLKPIGLLDVHTVSEYLESGYEAIDKFGSLTVDLSETNIVGSAGVALLIAWQRRALERQKPFVIKNAPDHFMAMAKVSGVLDILPFADRD